MDRRALGLLAGLIVVWGANWPILKVGLIDITPLWFAAIRLAMGAACLFAVLLLLGRRPRPPALADLPVLASVGLLQMAGFMVLISYGLLVVGAGRAAILAYTTPLWVTPGAILFLDETPSRRQLAGLALGISGVAVLFNPFGFDWGERAALIGNGCLLLAALGWAIAILHVRGRRRPLDPLALAPWQMLLATAPVLALAWWLEPPERIAWTPRLWAVLAYNGPLATAFGFWAVVTVTRRLPAVTASLAFLGVPATGMIIAASTLGEPLTPTNLIGLALIVGGVVLVARASPGAEASSRHRPRGGQP